MSDDNDLEEDFVPKRKSVKNTIASDDENGDSDTPPIHTEDITLHLSDEEDNEETNEEPNLSEPPLEARQQIISSGFTEGLNPQDNINNISPESSVPINVSPTPINVSPTPEAKKPKQVPFQSLIDSDSEPEEGTKQNDRSTISKDNFSDQSQDAPSPKKNKKKSKPAQQKRRSIWDSDSEDDETADNRTNPPPKHSSLIDSDSDDAVQPMKNSARKGTKTKDSGKSKISGKSAAGTKKKSSSKDAMLTIRSESQRMTRESAVSLPYHRPKQHSLEDFLNRPRFTPSSIKAPIEELIKFQEESKRVIKEFFQSESEHSDDDKDDDPDWNEEQDKKGGEENGKKKENTETGEENGKKKENMETGEENARKCDQDRDIDTIINEAKEACMKNIKDNGVKVNDVGKESDDVGMETEEIVLDEKLSDQNEEEKENCYKKNDGDVDTDDVIETEERVVDEKVEGQNEVKEGSSVGSEVEKVNGEVVRASKEGENIRNAKNPQKEMQEDMDGLEIAEEVKKKTEESEKSDSCPIDSQDLKLKYSEDFSEAMRGHKFDPISDSEDENVQMVKELPIPKEEPKITLKGNPEDVVDLGEDFTILSEKKKKQEDLECLKNRFLRHSLSAKPKASPQTLSVKVVDLASDGSIKGINEETLTWNAVKAPVDDTPPGLKMKRLKQELQRKIIEQRDKEFDEKMSSEVKAAKEDFEDGDDLLDDEEEDDDGASCATGDDEAADGDDEDADDEVDDDVDDEIDEDDEEESHERSQKKKKKRSAFVDDEASVDDDDDDDDVDGGNSEEDDEESKEDENSVDAKKSQFSRSDTNVDMFASQMSDEDDMIPGYQPCGGHWNASPVSQPRSTATSSAQNTTESSRLPEVTQDSPNSSFQKSFRFGTDFNSQSADFSTTQILKKYSEEKKDGIMQLALSPEVPETEADLMAMCSGQFTTQPFQLESQGGNLARPDNDAMADSQDSQDLQLKWTEDSPTAESESTEKVGKSRLVIESSDEDGGDGEDEETTSKRKTRRLSFSDEESNSVAADDFINDEEEEEGDEEAVDLQEPAYVMYDSDENEIPIKGAAAFLENEAELSEDEYVGSGDEDEEGDNDRMEEELGDLDEFDQDKVREELGRIHMRNVLDEDRRDVRLMQEMLLEDGEFHEDGKGRQRQFRWRNADSAMLLASQEGGSDEEKVDEDEDDGEWRQNRHEREMFLAGVLKDKDGKSVEIAVESQEEDSELLVLGKTCLKRQSSTRIEVKETVTKPEQPSTIPDSPMKSLFARQHSRGSFLTRTSDVLTRLAENASSKNGITESKMKNSRNFVFSAVSPPKEQENADDIENEPRPNAKRKPKRSLIAQPEKKVCTSQSSQYTGLFNYL